MALNVDHKPDEAYQSIQISVEIAAEAQRKIVRLFGKNDTAADFNELIANVFGRWLESLLAILPDEAAHEREATDSLFQPEEGETGSAEDTRNAGVSQMPTLDELMTMPGEERNNWLKKAGLAEEASMNDPELSMSADLSEHCVYPEPSKAATSAQAPARPAKR